MPDGLRRLDVATDTIWIVARLEVRGPDDVANDDATLSVQETTYSDSPVEKQRASTLPFWRSNS